MRVLGSGRFDVAQEELPAPQLDQATGVKQYEEFRKSQAEPLIPGISGPS
jgi:hypothetical protein